jgi:predicted homoserine dehydrogenase-like protein
VSIVDNALATRGRQGRPIRVGMIGAGFMGARVALFGDEVPSLARPVVEVCAVAKRDLKAGEVLDEYGLYTTYGNAVDVEEMSAKQ